jgi:predicted GIY-YIG superfamily endonuclease
MYILECVDGSYYTGSTKNLELRFQQHQNGKPRFLRQSQEADASLANPGKTLAEPVEASDNPIPKSKQWKQ